LDTSLTLIALGYAGFTKDHPDINNTINYLLNSCSEKLTWGISPDQRKIPDCDDTAVTTVALRNMGVQKEKLEPAIDWLFKMQSFDGGWSAYTRNNRKIKHYSTNLEDPTFLLKDPCTADVTGHVLHAMGKMGYTINHPRIQKAIRFLKEDQMRFGLSMADGVYVIPMAQAVSCGA